MKTFKPARWLALLGCSVALTAGSLTAGYAANMTKEEASAEKTRIDAEYKTDRKACDAMSGNSKDVCIEQAKGKEKVARAELDYKQDGSERHRGKVAEAKADAQYAVAKEKCDDQKGDAKSACKKAAKAEHEGAIAQARKASMNEEPKTKQAKTKQ